jgi:hypothetical protein
VRLYELARPLRPFPRDITRQIDRRHHEQLLEPIVQRFGQRFAGSQPSATTGSQPTPQATPHHISRRCLTSLNNEKPATNRGFLVQAESPTPGWHRVPYAVMVNAPETTESVVSHGLGSGAATTMLPRRSIGLDQGRGDQCCDERDSPRPLKSCKRTDICTACHDVLVCGARESSASL